MMHPADERRSFLEDCKKYRKCFNRGILTRCEIIAAKIDRMAEMYPYVHARYTALCTALGRRPPRF